ncbi:hypothetical protein BD410DRAFT_780561, partial [Rickenella mellea]
MSRFISEMEMEPLELPNLKKASLIFRSCDAKFFICALIRGFHLPELTEITVNVQSCQPEAELLVEWLLPHPIHYPSLENYVLLLSETGTLDLETFADQMPNLKYLSFEGCGDKTY